MLRPIASNGLQLYEYKKHISNIYKILSNDKKKLTRV